MIVIDASAAVEVLLRRSGAPKLEDRLFAGSEALHAPQLIDLEIAQVLRRHARRRELPVARCDEALADWLAFPVWRHGHELLLPRIWELRDTLTAYDAAYVALAEALDAPLLTTDAKLAGAPGHRARVEVLG